MYVSSTGTILADEEMIFLGTSGTLNLHVNSEIVMLFLKKMVLNSQCETHVIVVFLNFSNNRLVVVVFFFYFLLADEGNC